MWDGEKFRGLDSGCVFDERPLGAAVLHFLRSNLAYLEEGADRCSDSLLVRLGDIENPSDAQRGRTYASLGEATIRMVPVQFDRRVESVSVDLFSKVYAPYNLSVSANESQVRVGVTVVGANSAAVERESIGEGFNLTRIEVEGPFDAGQALLMVTIRSLQADVDDTMNFDGLESPTVITVDGNVYDETATDNTSAPKIAAGATRQDNTTYNEAADHLVSVDDKTMAISRVSASSLAGADNAQTLTVSRIQPLAMGVEIDYSSDRIGLDELRANIVEEPQIINRLARWARNIYTRPRMVSLGVAGEYIDDQYPSWPAATRSMWPTVDGDDTKTELARVSVEHTGDLDVVQVPFFAMGVHHDAKPIDSTQPSGAVDIQDLFANAATARWDLTVAIEQHVDGSSGTTTVDESTRTIEMEHVPNGRLVGLPALSQAYWQRFHPDDEDRRFTYREGMVSGSDRKVIDERQASISVDTTDLNSDPFDVVVYAELNSGFDPEYRYQSSQGVKDREVDEPDDSWTVSNLRLYWIGHSIYISREV